MRLKIMPCELKDANAFIAQHHRHHQPVQGHRFSLRVVDESEQTVGVCTVGRPVARMTNPRTTLEVTRLCTDGTKNACSALYSSAARVGKEMGYEKIQTFILETESGDSLKAAGWDKETESAGGSWTRTSRDRREDQPKCGKTRWGRALKRSAA